MRVWGFLVLLAAAHAAPQADIKASSCRCTSKPLPGFRDSSCTCATNPTSVYDSVLALGNLLSTSAQASVAPVTSDSCICDVTELKGYAKGTCTCDAIKVDCPSHTTEHPDCWPEEGYAGNVKWDAALERYVIEDPTSHEELEKLKEVGCGDLGGVGTWPNCQCAAGYDGEYRWNNQTFEWSNTCSAVECPDFATGKPFCGCGEGFVNNETDPVLWNSQSRIWDGSCEKVHCPEATLASSHPGCTCKRGYSGQSVFKTGTYTHNCSLETCIVNAEHEGDACVCKKGYYSSDTEPLEWDSSSQAWIGNCTRRECPVNAGSHPECKCDRGYWGDLEWNSGTRQYDGDCNESDCPLHASGETCSCNTGYYHVSAEGVEDDFDDKTREWTHSCQPKGCPIGSTSEDPSRCSCNAPGYKGVLAWSGTAWSACEEVFCPIHTTSISSEDGVVSCVCNVGYEGAVTWDAPTSSWLSTCRPSDCHAFNQCNLDTFSAECTPGYKGLVTWNEDQQQWDSTCSPVECPAGSQDHPGCTCKPGYSGGASASGKLFWHQAGELSHYKGYCSERVSDEETKTACQDSTLNLSCSSSVLEIVSATFGRSDTTTCASTPQTVSSCSAANALSLVHTRCDNRTSCSVPASTQEFGDPCVGATKYLTVQYRCVESVQQVCDKTCSEVPCPDHASKNDDGSCTCNYGYTGSVDWIRPHYVGQCLPATCPVNATGSGPTCECPKGYLPSEDFGFAAGEWSGECEYQSCGAHTKNWPECECQDHHYFADRVPIAWEGGAGGRGFTGSCIPWSCPSNSSVPGVCKCDRGFATKVNQELVSGPVWDAAGGQWLHHCEYTSCGKGGDESTHPACSCMAGYRGFPAWNSNQFESCTEVACLEEYNMQAVTEVTAPWAKPITSHSCMCKDGFVGTVDWNYATQEWTGSCTKAECPAPADCTATSSARCSDGFHGSVTWSGNSFVNGSWDVQCEFVACPENAETHPDCTCAMGFAGGKVQWDDANNWTTSCQEVKCPAHAVKGPAGTCACSEGYDGTIEWISTNATYIGSCQLIGCPINAVGSPACTCARGFSPSVDFGFSNGRWHGSCHAVDCPENASSDKNCSCITGFEGTIAWNPNTFEYDGECTYVDCPPNTAGPDCACAIGYSGVGMWDGEAWTHSCHSVECPAKTVQVDLPRGHTCVCPARTRGTPVWTGTEWEAECVDVPCPSRSELDPVNGTKCNCDLGYAGYPVWDPATMDWTGSCSPVSCPEGTDGQGAHLGCSCVRGEAGECEVNTSTQEFECDCTPRDCPTNAEMSETSNLCTCRKGYAGTLEWDEPSQNYTGLCVRKECALDVPNSSNHPNCSCSTGYAGRVAWDDATDQYVGNCQFIGCPAFTTDHPSCSLVSGYRYKDAKPITWSANDEQWVGSAQLIPCPANATGAPNCSCLTGFRDSGINVQGQEYVGSCEYIPCPAGHGGFPACSCNEGYTGSITWNEDAGKWDMTCATAPCPANSHTPHKCICKEGYRGVPKWNATSQEWVHSCEKMFCPPHSENHPSCTCMSGYTGTINYSPSAGYSGQCNIASCPAQSRRIGGSVPKNADGLVKLSNISTSAVLMIKHVNGDIKAFVDVIDGEHWAKVIQWKTSYIPSQAAFGVIASSEIGTGKMSDEQINALTVSGQRTYMIDWDATQKGDVPRKLFITTSQPHNDVAASFGIIADSTKAVLSASSPKSDAPTSAYTTRHIDSAHSAPVLSDAQDCYRLLMGSDTSYDCKTKADSRCLSGGSACTSGDDDFPTLNNVQVFVKLDESLTVYQTSDEAHHTPTNLTLIEADIPGCECYVGCSGGFDWVGERYQGQCVCTECPTDADCTALRTNPATEQTIFPAAKGFNGHVVWTGSQWDSSAISKVDCLDETTGHPECHCDLGFAGTVDWSSLFVGDTSTGSYTEHCDLVACPSAMMARGATPHGLPQCTCPVGYVGVATWDVASQSYLGAVSCELAHCSDSKMAKSDDLTRCSCPVGFKGHMYYDVHSQSYIGAAQCEEAECPVGATCDTNPETRKCDEFFSGSYHWDSQTEEWAHDCKQVECSINAKRKSGDSVNGCVCRVGWQPAASWDPVDQKYRGCSEHASCPANADSAALSPETNGRTCPCPVGHYGRASWHAAEAEYTHTCTRRPCPEGSALQGNVCQCEVGFTGGLEWNTNSQDYDGSCQIARCPDTGVNCTFATDSERRPALASLPCKQAYFGSALWNYTTQAWVNQCQLRPCPDHAGVLRDARTEVCACKWGYAGSVTWNSETSNYDHTCTKVECPAPTTDVGGVCSCPRGSKLGQNRFLEDDTWSVHCEAIVPCPSNSTGAPSCTCDQGYAGQVELATSIDILENIQVMSYESTATYEGSCSAVACPANSLEGSFPACECANGFAGAIEWKSDSQTWLSSCKVAKCPDFASQGPGCGCNKGYVGTLSFNRAFQNWTGTCQLATCPDNASAGYDGQEPTCKCNNGFKATPRWSATEGWVHVCEDVACPDFSSKVETTTAVSYQEIRGFVGCHKDGVSLGRIGNPRDVLDDVSTFCTGGAMDPECVALGKRACEHLIATGRECWGFATANNNRVYLYTAAASDYSVCDPDTGLQRNADWTAFKRRSATGDCRCVPGYGGGFIYSGDAYVGSCSMDKCPPHSTCGTEVVCEQGYYNASSFVWNYDLEKWEGECLPRACGEHDDPDSFPKCACASGYAGGEHGWDFESETWTGTCEHVPCPDHTDNNHPSCKCSTGYIRDDGVANQPLAWGGDKWADSCVAVDCPGNSSRIANGNCQCDPGYKGHPSFSLPYGNFTVTGSGDINACTRVACPTNSEETRVTNPENPTGPGLPVCSCLDGFTGDLTWNPAPSFSWGSCEEKRCPDHSSHHPYCACDPGYTGQLVWNGVEWEGDCLEADTTASWGAATLDLSKAVCTTVTGAATSVASATENEMLFTFAGGAETVNVLRCDVQVAREFSKVRGSFAVTATAGTAHNNVAFVTWNSPMVTAATNYVAFGTPFNLVDPGMEGGSQAKEYAVDASTTITVPESAVTSTDTLRFEVSQPAGVALRVSNVVLDTYSMPTEVVSMTRTTVTQS